jgi:hypothetical protein
MNLSYQPTVAVVVGATRGVAKALGEFADALERAGAAGGDGSVEWLWALPFAYEAAAFWVANLPSRLGDAVGGSAEARDLVEAATGAAYDGERWAQILEDIRFNIELLEWHEPGVEVAAEDVEILAHLRRLLPSAETAERQLVPVEVWRLVVGPLPPVPL